MNGINLYMTSAEACYVYGVSRKTLNSRLNSKTKLIDQALKDGLVKRFKNPSNQRSEWIISRDFMNKYY